MYGDQKENQCKEACVISSKYSASSTKEVIPLSIIVKFAFNKFLRIGYKCPENHTVTSVEINMSASYSWCQC